MLFLVCLAWKHKNKKKTIIKKNWQNLFRYEETREKDEEKKKHMHREIYICIFSYRMPNGQKIIPEPEQAGAGAGCNEQSLAVYRAALITAKELDGTAQTPGYKTK